MRLAKHDKLHDMINELAESIVSIRREQEYMVIRERTHRMSMSLALQVW